jgi:2-polyprenyl-6-hydroxyphenyl methylase/3-demethylubiquinone-9 3-methyltransferase
VPADNSIYDTLDDWWDPTGSVAGIHAMNPARAGYFRGVLQTRLGPDLSGVRVLDVGCGGGILTEELLRPGATAIGVDQAEAAVRCATAHGRAGGLSPRYVRARGEQLPFEDGSFPVVMTSDFLEHVMDLTSIVQECARVLAPGGCFCTTPSTGRG